VHAERGWECACGESVHAERVCMQREVRSPLAGRQAEGHVGRHKAEAS